MLKGRAHVATARAREFIKFKRRERLMPLPPNFYFFKNLFIISIIAERYCTLPLPDVKHSGG